MKWQVVTVIGNRLRVTVLFITFSSQVFVPRALQLAWRNLAILLKYHGEKSNLLYILKMITAIVIDDEAHSVETLIWKLENYCPAIKTVASFNDPQEGLAYIEANPIDLLFLDIEMPTLSGFDLLQKLGKLILM